MSWAAIKISLRKAWAWIKKYWKFLVGAAVPLAVWILFRNRDNLDEVISRIREDHQRDIDIIDKSNRVEDKLAEEARQRHEETVARIEEEHAAAKVELDEKKRERIREIVETHESDPEEITRRIAELTGIRLGD